MLRYLRLYGCFLRFSFSRSAQFRVDFFFRVLMDTLWYAHYIVFFVILGVLSPTVGGWDADQLRVFTGALFVVDAMQMTFFANSLWTFPWSVNRGDLDYHLVRPVSSIFFVGFRDIAVSSFVNLLMATGVLVWAILRFPGPMPVGSLAVFVVLLLAGVGIHFTFHFLALIPAFWTQSTRGLRDVFWSLDQYMARPDGVFKGMIRRVITTVLPLGVIVAFPCRALFEGPRLSIVLHMFAALFGTSLALAFFWRRGLRAYGSASS